MRATQSRIREREYILLAPPQTEAPRVFRHFHVDEERHSQLLAATQRLRGQIYLADGAIDASQLCQDGQHRLPADGQSWHLLLMEEGAVAGCMRYRNHRDVRRASTLGVLRCGQAGCEEWGPKLRAAVQADIDLAQREGIGYGEAGGWALSEPVRHSAEALRMVLGTYSLAQLLGEAIVFSTATMRNGSAPILRRIGGQSLMTESTELPPYYDPEYQCEMQVLRFDSRQPNPKYSQWVHELRRSIAASPVFCGELIPPLSRSLKAQPVFA